jgi:hypothetical protein
MSEICRLIYSLSIGLFVVFLGSAGWNGTFLGSAADVGGGSGRGQTIGSDMPTGHVAPSDLLGPEMIGGICVWRFASPLGLGGQNKNARWGVRYFAIPKEDGCVGLRLDRDLFSESVIYGDDYFLPILKIVAKILRVEELGEGDSLRELEDGVRAELLRRQMSALTELRLDFSGEYDYDTYRVYFYLPDVDVNVVLLIREDGGYYEWAIITE